MKPKLRPLGKDSNIIGVVPVGTVDDMVPKSVAAHIFVHLNLETRVTATCAIPAKAFNQRKFQYDAALILETLEKSSSLCYNKIIGVSEVDLFVPIFSYVYGEARQGGMCAVISTFRLRATRNSMTVPTDLLLERSAKVALHELGHLFNLPHCRDVRCLMHFAGDLHTLDNTRPLFCRYCKAFWQNAVTRR